MKIVWRLARLMAAIAITGMTFHSLGQEPSQQVKLYVYSGILRSIDLHVRTIIVDGSAVPRKFEVPTDAEITVKSKPKGELSDLMVGDGIQVEYTEDNGVNVAHQVSPLGVENP
jgi:hypothetical protein